MDTFAYIRLQSAVHQLTRHLAKTLAPKITVERHRSRAVPFDK